MSSDAENIYLKVLGPNRTAFHGGRGQWAAPGVWMPTIPNPQPCSRGYHVLADTRQALDWIGPEFWLVEVDGPVIADTNKCVVGQARLVEQLPWDERSARLFACDVAEDVLPIWERDYPNDSRPRDCIEVARQFANGDATQAELAAAEAAARVAAWAARDAAWAARDAAWAAAWAAARAAARAARDAAGDAAGAAARDAAGAAPLTAARAAARDRQAVLLADYLGVEPPADSQENPR